MAPRRSHRKSRNGCDQCKLRRVKCDERGPFCANCTNRELECSYSSKSTSQRSNRPKPSITPPTLRQENEGFVSLSGPDSNATLTKAESLQRLELFHHWSTHTCFTFCYQNDQTTGEAEVKALREKLPIIAFQQESVLYAILAIVSMHIASKSEGLESASYAAASLRYQSNSMDLFNREIDHANKENCHGIFFCSLVYIALKSTGPRLLVTGRQPVSARDRLFALLRLIHSTQSITCPFKRDLMSGPLVNIIMSDDLPPYSEFETGLRNVLMRLNRINKSRLLESYKFSYRVNTAAIDGLERRLMSYLGGVRIAIMVWLVRIGEDYTFLLEQNDFVANLVLAHWATFLDQPDNVWYTFSPGKALVGELTSTMSGATSDECDAIMWCRRKVGLAPNDVGVDRRRSRADIPTAPVSFN